MSSSNTNPDLKNNFKLEAQTPFNGFSKRFDGVEVSELLGHSMVSMALPTDALSADALGTDQQSALAKNIKATFNTDLPEVGKFTIPSEDNTRILRFQQNQCFVLFENESVYQNDNAVPYIKEKIKDAAYLSDQSDSWAMLKISGKNTRAALERVCQINLNATSHPPTFGPFSVTRTSMEYLSVIIMQTDENEYYLFSPRSSADAFLHMILTSIENVI